jgi:DNA polymerase-1
MTKYWEPEEVRYGHIDGDLLIYSGAARFNDAETFDPIAAYLDEEITYIRETVGLDDFTVYVTAGGNFRKDVYPEYKANRRKTEKPKWLGECYRYLYKEWAAQAERTYEADDLLGIALTQDPDGLLISYDKDLDQVPGWHFNWRKNQMYHVEPMQGDRFLALQCLTGDRTDNIPGVPGIGPKKAEGLIRDYGSMASFLEDVLAVYYEKGLDFSTFEQYYKCLKILRNPVQQWPELRELPGSNEEE